MKYIFKQIDEYTPSETTVEFTVDNINDVLEQFELFLKGCGFQFNGKLDIVPDEEYYGLEESEGQDLEHSIQYFDTERNK